jgi:hypothetical protein
VRLADPPPPARFPCSRPPLGYKAVRQGRTPDPKEETAEGFARSEPEGFAGNPPGGTWSRREEMGERPPPEPLRSGGPRRSGRQWEVLQFVESEGQVVQIVGAVLVESRQ